MAINISDNDPRIHYTATAGQILFIIPFTTFDDNDLLVYVNGVLKTITSDYTIANGELTLLSAASLGDKIALTRNVPIERTTDLTSSYSASAIDDQLDRIVSQIADLDDKAGRSIQIADSELATSLDLPLVDDRKGKTIQFNSVTGALEAGPTSNDIATIANNIAEILAADDEAAAAALSATASATSATASAASAVDATNNGAAQVALAAGQVTLAETAKTAAELAETNAETAESNASTSATNAATSETNASTSASTASTKAAEAVTSATNAATSATEAETAKTGAETARDAALAALDSFDDRYLGVKTSDPTVDNDGDALVVGSIYFNSNTDLLYVYNGTTWQVTANAASGDLVSTNNLSDLTSHATARTNLGLGTAATTASTDYATAAQGTLADSAVQPNDSPTFDGLTVEGADGDIVRIASTVDSGTQQEFGIGFATNPSHTHPAAQILAKEFDASDSRAGLNFYTRPNNSDTASVKRLNIDTGGDISFYEDTGTTPKFFWDASAESLGIGTSSPSTNLDVVGGIRSTSSGGYNQITTTSIGDAVFNNNGNNWLTVKDGVPANAMRIDSSGRVGVGTTNPATALDVDGTVTATAFAGDGSALTGVDADLLGGLSEATFMRRSANSGLDMNNNNITDVEDIYLQDKIYHDGDTDTFMQFHAADQWRVVTGGTERLEVNNSTMTVAATLSMNAHDIDMNGNDIVDVEDIRTSSGAKVFFPRAWVNFNGQSTVSIRDSGNVSSITDLGTGKFRINFTSPYSNASYAMSGSGANTVASSDTFTNAYSFATSSVTVGVNTMDGDLVDRTYSTVTTVGNQ